VKILSARWTGFRNLDDAEVRFSPGVNLLLGRNGQGKTNVLEALNFLSLGRSHRGARAEELIQFGRDALHVALTMTDDHGERHTCEYGLDRRGGRRIRVDGEVLSRRSDLVGRLATVFFWPESVDLVRGGPELRRRFADQGLSGLAASYLRSLVAYQRGLRQKSRLLKDLRRGLRDRATAGEELAAWNRDLASHALTLGLGRADWAAALQPWAAAGYRELAGNSGGLEFVYRPRLQALHPGRQAPRTEAEKVQFQAEILAEFDYIGSEETRRGRPLTGPQFDDFDVRLGDRDLRVYGSQGETRTAAIALILAQSDVVFQRRRVRPVLFLDDIFSELDRERARRLQERCARDHQIFIASARADDVAGWSPADRRQWRVEDGRLTTLP
jgi:DNA replication and repair protein RecF